MTWRTWFAIVAGSVLLALIVTLAAGVWAPRAEASKPVAALPSVGAPTSEPALLRQSLAQRFGAVPLDLALRDDVGLADEAGAQLLAVDLDAQRGSRQPKTGGGFGEGEHLATGDAAVLVPDADLVGDGGRSAAGQLLRRLEDVAAAVGHLADESFVALVAGSALVVHWFPFAVVDDVNVHDRVYDVNTQSGAIGTVLIGGWASWYDNGRGLYGAAGPVLREALGSKWRGQYVTVEGDGRSVTLQLTDWCACSDRNGTPTIVDLSLDAFSELADPSLGLVRVSIELDLPEHPDDARMRLEDMALPRTDAL